MHGLMTNQRGALLFTMLMLVFAGGCSQTQYGSRDRSVTLESEPSGAKAYIVPNQVWLKWIEDNESAKTSSLATTRVEMLRLADKNGKLEKYEKGTTPLTIELPPYETVFVAKQKDDQIAFKVFTPKDFKTTVTVSFPGATTPGTSSGH